VNARPITYVYDDKESISFSLTPSHLVYGHGGDLLPRKRSLNYKCNFVCF
jgi:hypothetical protein